MHKHGKPRSPFSTSHQQVFSRSQESRAHHAEWLLGKTNAVIPRVSPSSFTPALSLASCPGPVPSLLLVHPQLSRWQGSTRSCNILSSMEHCYAATKTLECYRHGFQQKSKAQHHRRLWRKLCPRQNSVPAVTDTVSISIKKKKKKVHRYMVV